MKAEYSENWSCPQRNSAEHEKYVGAQSAGSREVGEQGGADLLDRILGGDNLNRAYKQVRANKGAPGIDGMTILALRCVEICEDLFLQESRKSLCHKDLSGFYGLIRSYENRPLSNNTEFDIVDILLKRINLIEFYHKKVIFQYSPQIISAFFLISGSPPNIRKQPKGERTWVKFLCGCGIFLCLRTGGAVAWNVNAKRIGGNRRKPGRSDVNVNTYRLCPDDDHRGVGGKQFQ